MKRNLGLFNNRVVEFYQKSITDGKMIPMCGSDYIRFTDGRKSIQRIISESKVWAKNHNKNLNKGIISFRVCIMINYSNTRYLTDFIYID